MMTATDTGKSSWLDETVMEILDGYPDLAVIRLPDGDVDGWWRELYLAADDEYHFGLVDTDEPVTDGWTETYGNAGEYVDELVRAWLQRHIEPPGWKWYRWTPASEYDGDVDEDGAGVDGFTHFLESVTAEQAPGPQWWRGAIVRRKTTQDGGL